MNLMTHKVDHKTNTFFLLLLNYVSSQKLPQEVLLLGTHVWRNRPALRDVVGGCSQTIFFLEIHHVADDGVKKKKEKIFKKNQHDMNIIVARGAAEP